MSSGMGDRHRATVRLLQLTTLNLPLGRNLRPGKGCGMLA
jgi:hypothetical protein